MRKEQYIIALDQGTTSSRALLFDQDQNVVAISQEEIPPIFPFPGWVEQDANQIWLTTLSCMMKVVTKAKIDPSLVTSIGITNQRETTVVWNKKTGMPIYNAIVWQSRQTCDIVDRYRQMGLEEKIKEKTGLVLDPYFSATKIRWILEELNITDTSDLLAGTVDSWLVWKLTKGQKHITDVTNASRTLLMDLTTLDWDEELLEWFGIDRNMLPTIVASSAELGRVHPDLFYQSSPLIGSMIGDQQSALFGQSCFSKGDCKNTYGTGGFLLMNTGAHPIFSQHGLLTTVAWKIGNQVQYALEGSIFVSGSLIQWMRDELKLFEKASQTEEIAESVDSCGGVIIVPAFTGLGAPYWNDQCRGAIYGLSRGTDRRHLVRAALESMAYQSKDLIHVMEQDIETKIPYLKVDGGASENKFLNQFQADILQMDVIKNTMSETTALGACRLAGLAAGIFTMDDFKEGNREVYHPKRDPGQVEKLYAKWKRAVQATLDV